MAIVYIGQSHGDMPVAPVKAKPALRIGPDQRRQPPLDDGNGVGALTDRF